MWNIHNRIYVMFYFQKAWFTKVQLWQILKEIYVIKVHRTLKKILFLSLKTADPDPLASDSFFYTPPLKCGEVLCYTLRCLSVRPSVRPCLPFPIDNLSIYSWNFFKFCIRPFLTELLPFFILEKWFLACYSLLFMISEWNFTDMLHIKGYILWLRTVTLTFPVCELSALDRSEKRFLTYCSFTTWNIWI